MVAINTDYTKTLPNTEHTKKMLKTIANRGFSHIHWVHDWKGTYEYNFNEMIQIDKWLKEYGLKAKGVHASDGTVNEYFDDRKMFISPNEPNRLAGVQLVKNRIDLAQVINAGEIVLHLKLFHELMPGTDYDVLKDTYWEQLYKSMDEIIAYGEEKKIRVAIENMEAPRLELQFEQFDRLFNRYPKDTLGFCFDLGHNMICSKENPFQALERYKDRLFSLHLNCASYASNASNYNEVLKHDEHSILTKEKVDIEGLAKLIAKSPYELPVTFEISAKGDINEELKNTLDIGNEINQLVTQYRNQAINEM